MKHIEEILTEDIRSVAIAGHINPDGDCIGSCTALCRYIRMNCPHIRTVDLYLEEPKDELRFLCDVCGFAEEAPAGKIYDLVITCDVSDYDRIAVAAPLFDAAKRRVSIDHHISNPGFADVNHVEPDASSCAEVLAGLMEPGLVDRQTAEALYTGIIHDCGVFQYKNTSPRTMRTAAALMEKGIDFSRIIDDSFNRRSFKQNRVLGHCLLRAETCLSGRCVTTSITLKEMEDLGVEKKDLDLIVAQLRLTEGAEAAVFAYEIEADVFKISLRSNEYLDVSKVAAGFGGGGHVRAAGCMLPGTADEVLRRVTEAIGKELRA